MLEGFVGEPADGGGGHLIKDARVQAAEEALEAGGAQHERGRLRQPVRRRLLRVERRLADVERRGSGGGQRARQPARQRVRRGVVRARRVHARLAPLVRHEVHRLRTRVTFTSRSRHMYKEAAVTKDWGRRRLT